MEENCDCKLHKNYKSYADRYYDEIDKIKKVEELFIHHEEEINYAFQQLQTLGPPVKMHGAT